MFIYTIIKRWLWSWILSFGKSLIMLYAAGWKNLIFFFYLCFLICYWQTVQLYLLSFSGVEEGLISIRIVNIPSVWLEKLVWLQSFPDIWRCETSGKPAITEVRDSWKLNNFNGMQIRIQKNPCGKYTVLRTLCDFIMKKLNFASSTTADSQQHDNCHEIRGARFIAEGNCWKRD